jgi:large subunit ribosomal protein L29
MKLEKDKKWKWPAEKMREWTDDELRTREREFSDQLFRLKFQMAGGKSEHLPAIRELRKGIARVKTLAQERSTSAKQAKA